MAEVAAVDMADNANSIRQSVPVVVRKPRFLSSPVVPNPYTAGHVTSPVTKTLDVIGFVSGEDARTAYYKQENYRDVC